MAASKYPNYETVLSYAQNIVDGSKIACVETKQSAERFLRDLDNPAYDFRTADAEFVIQIIENTIVHVKGTKAGQPFLLEPWEKFICYNLAGFYLAGTDERRFKEAFIFIPRKNGKALDIDTPMLTTDGWKTMGTIERGDFVYGRAGTPVRVEYKSDVFEGHDCYSVTFEDGAEIIADAEHIWKVRTKDSRRLAKRECHRSLRLQYDCDGYYNITTAELFSKSLYYDRPDRKGREYRYRVPMNAPVQTAPKKLKVDPYILGLWLGDGDKSAPRLTCSEDGAPEIMALITSHGQKNHIAINHNRAPRIAMGDGVRGGASKSTLKSALRDIGVLGAKHIPEDYMMASYEQRMELLRGLMDTDGTVSKSGECSFCQKDNAFAEQVRELLWSLGIKNTIRKKTIFCGDVECHANEITFYASKKNCCFNMRRKAMRLKARLSPRMNAKSIISIKKVDSVKTQCIAVDAPDSLYLAGKSCTVTHNTPFAASVTWALSLLDRKTASSAYIIANRLDRALESFDFINKNLRYMGETEEFHVLDSNAEHSISRDFFDGDGNLTGSISIQALANNSKFADGINGNLIILDEIHAYKSPDDYLVYKDAMKAYVNKLLIGITTAGKNINSFCYGRLQLCQKILAGTVQDEQYFIFICKADNIDDYTNPVEHEKANPNYGVTIRPQDIMADALQAMNDPKSRNNFLNKSLNIYTNVANAYFDINEVQESDKCYSWTLEELARLPITWIGGADLSVMHDLTAADLYGEYTFNGKPVSIIISHGFIPIVTAQKKADEDDIPFFWWKDNGWLTLCNGDTVDYGEVVKQFKGWRAMGFKIKCVSFDKYNSREFVRMMKAANFKMENGDQQYWKKSEAFRYTEKRILDKCLYYVHNRAYEYCIGNVKAVEDPDERMRYEKVDDVHRMDLFDAGIIACKQYIIMQDSKHKIDSWFS